MRIALAPDANRVSKWMGRRPVVVDLSSLWAGPLCSHVLSLAGARVIKVESTRRPDAGRSAERFFDLLHAGQESVALDFTQPGDRARLRALIAAADLVIEGSRPRALEQLGIEPRECLRERPDLVWLSLTAYGRDGPWRHHVGFGDDTAVAGGLVGRDVAGRPLFIGDALADPITGLLAAAYALAALSAGGGCLLDIALRDAAAFACAAPALPASDLRVFEEGGLWFVGIDEVTEAVAQPVARPDRGTAPALGADTTRILRELT
jgi:crotonobetainyl-CoA:carnitine CoA-transferase CaiB-like acyl-CoA transferase